LTINRLCGSGFETVALAANSIKLGESKIVIAGGSENMSAAPLQIGGNDARWGVNLGAGLKVEDALWSGLTDSYAGTPMGITAENLAVKYVASERAVRTKTRSKALRLDAPLLTLLGRSATTSIIVASLLVVHSACG